MKISDLLTEVQAFYGPSYRSELQQKYDRKTGQPLKYTRTGLIVGDQEDWLKLIGATRADLKPAMEKARETPEYQQLLKIFKEVPSPLGTRNGTFVFSGHKGSFLGDEQGERVHRRIMPHGKIVGASTKRTGELTSYTFRLKSLEPATEQTHPELTPQERLVHNYRRAFEQLFKVQYPIFRDALKKRLMKDKES